MVLPLLLLLLLPKLMGQMDPETQKVNETLIVCSFLRFSHLQYLHQLYSVCLCD